MQNPYIPYPVDVRAITAENEAKNIKTFELVFHDQVDREHFAFHCGQFGEIGFVPSVLEKVNPSPENAMVITCGPPIMIKFVLVSLSRMKFTPDQIITTLEMKMKCGLGKCGRCNIGPAYVCKHGPVFDYAQLMELPDEY